MSAVTAPVPAPDPGPDRPASLPYGPPFLIGDPAAARHDLTLLRRALAASGVVAEAAVAWGLGRFLGRVHPGLMRFGAGPAAPAHGETA
jgi:hypothetical protein